MMLMDVEKEQLLSDHDNGFTGLENGLNKRSNAVYKLRHSLLLHALLIISYTLASFYYVRSFTVKDATSLHRG